MHDASLQAVASPLGISLIFSDEETLEFVIERLQTQLDWARENDVEPPYIFHTTVMDTSLDGQDFDEVDRYTSWLKEVFSLDYGEFDAPPKSES